jgi:hypothetical protein
MSRTVCLAANSLGYPNGGSYLWIYLNWALGLRAAGCRVIWLETFNRKTTPERLRELVLALRAHLEPYGLDDAVAIYSRRGDATPTEVEGLCLDLDAATEADLLLDLCYGWDAAVVGRFCGSVLVDIDPGQLQVWITKGQMTVAPHDLYFSIGETIGQPGSPVPDCGVEWQYTPPPVSLTEWTFTPPPADPHASYTTITHWWGPAMEYKGETFENDKRSAFLEFQCLPAHTRAPMELAVLLAKGETEERRRWEGSGWRLRHPWEVSDTPAACRAYIQGSRGEFSCAKPSYVRFNTGWLSDRTVCYLASGRPAILQYTGPNRSLPEGHGVFRFRTLDDAARALATVEADYERQCRLARCLAEEQFDAKQVVGRVLERALS